MSHASVSLFGDQSRMLIPFVQLYTIFHIKHHQAMCLTIASFIQSVLKRVLNRYMGRRDIDSTDVEIVMNDVYGTEG